MTRRNTRRVAWRLVAACLGVGGWSGPAAVALTPSRLVVFGDSLSDIGNIDDATFGVVPGSTYFSGRFSNGPAWVEWLANDLGVGPLLASTAGGDNFAYGGAQTSGANGIGGLFIRDLDEQLSDYRASRTVDGNALYVVWAGANDLFDGQTDVNAPINRVVESLEILTALGARQFVVPNLPILGKIPDYNRDPVASTRFDQLAQQYNAVFSAVIERLAARHINATFYQLDVGELFSSAISSPAAWGLANVTDPAAPGLDPGAFFYNENRIVARPEQYLFWDTIHPTAAVHRILGEAAARLVDGVPGDFNTDGEVDGADLALWRSGLGTVNAVRRHGDADGDQDVDGADVLAWQRTLGTNLAAPPPASAAVVPEPRATGLRALGTTALVWTVWVRRTPRTGPRPPCPAVRPI
jgi:thermolabile hemolysin